MHVRASSLCAGMCARSAASFAELSDDEFARGAADTGSCASNDDDDATDEDEEQEEDSSDDSSSGISKPTQMGGTSSRVHHVRLTTVGSGAKTAKCKKTSTLRPTFVSKLSPSKLRMYKMDVQRDDDDKRMRELLGCLDAMRGAQHAA
jgi:hypothetical protein